MNKSYFQYFKATLLSSTLETNSIYVWFTLVRSKPGTAQVGFISKAQKYSRNNNWKNLEKYFFNKKYLVKKSHIAKKPKKSSFRLMKRSFKIESFKKIQRVPLERIQQFSKKVE